MRRRQSCGLSEHILLCLRVAGSTLRFACSSRARCAAATTTYCSFISLSSLKQEIIRQSYANSETVELEVVDAQTKEGAVMRCKSLNYLRC